MNKIRMEKLKIIKIAGKSTIYGYLNSILVFFQLGLIYRVLNNGALNGLWLTMFSVVSWIYLLDFGISNSLRNLIVKYEANKETSKIKEILSTGIFLSVLIFTTFFIIILFPIILLDWNVIFNIKSSIITNSELVLILVLLIAFTMIKVSFNVMNAIYNVTDRNHWINLMILSGTLISIVLISLINLVISSIDLTTIILIVSGSPIISAIVFFIIFKKSNGSLSPNLKSVNIGKIKDILKPGLYFLLLQLCSLLFYSSDTFLITHFLSPDSVNNYQYALKIMGISTLFFSALLNPLWTEIARIKNDVKKINNIVNKMVSFFFVFSIFIFLLNFFIKDIIQIITGTESDIDFILVNTISLFVILQMWCSLFQAVSNALNLLKLQVIVFGGGALLNIPLSIFIFKNIINNEVGIILGTIISLLIPAILIPLLLFKIKLKSKKILDSCEIKN